MKHIFAIALLVASVGCASRSTTPDEIALDTATYSTDVVRLVTEIQNAVNAYALEQGRSQPLDRVSEAIRDDVIPRARTLQTVLERYIVLRKTDGSLTPDNEQILRETLEAYEEAIKSVGAITLPEGLAGSVASTTFRIHQLILEIRKTFRLPPSSATTLEFRNGYLVAAL